MKQSEGKIGIREFIAIIAYTMGSKITDNTPTILYGTAKNAAWISGIVISLFALISILFLLKVMSVYKGENLYGVLVGLFGKFLGNLIAVGLLIFGFSALVFDAAIYVDIINTMYFIKTPSLVIYIFLILVCAYGAKKGIEHIGSTAWVTFVYVQASFILILVILMKESIPSLIHPLWGPGIGGIIQAAGKNVSIYTDFFFLCLLVPMVNSFKMFRKGTLLGWGFITIQFVISVMLFIMLFDFTSVEILNYPFHEAVRYLSFGFLTNTETLFLPFWLIVVFIRFAVYLYLIVLLFGNIFNIKEFEYLVPVISILVILFGLILDTPFANITKLREQLLVYLSPVFFLLPMLMWLVAKLKGDFKNESAIKSH